MKLARSSSGVERRRGPHLCSITLLNLLREACFLQQHLDPPPSELVPWGGVQSFQSTSCSRVAGFTSTSPWRQSRKVSAGVARKAASRVGVALDHRLKFSHFRPEGHGLKARRSTSRSTCPPKRHGLQTRGASRSPKRSKITFSSSVRKVIVLRDEVSLLRRSIY